MNLIDFILHIDKYLHLIVQNYGILSYFILFFIVFCETGLVFTPFLPGDSLLFVAGTLAANGVLNLFFLFLVFVIAAILGDTVNYWIGNYFGERVFLKSRFVNKNYIEKTKEFYKKHGGKTIVIARFIPIIRTFAPFIAGVGKMNYLRFLIFNIIGAIVWVGIFVFSGYYFGGISFVQNNLSFVLLGIILVSLIYPLIEYFRHRKKLINTLK